MANKKKKKTGKITSLKVERFHMERNAAAADAFQLKRDVAQTVSEYRSCLCIGRTHRQGCCQLSDQNDR